MLPDLWSCQYHARFNATTHGLLATWYHRMDLWANAVTAASASSALAGVLMTNEALGQVWTLLLGLAAILAVLRPLLRWSELHAQHTSLALAYRQVEWRSEGAAVEDLRRELAALDAQEPAEEGWLLAVAKARADARTRHEKQILA